jgi:hypothetical protein
MIDRPNALYRPATPGFSHAAYLSKCGQIPAVSMGKTGWPEGQLTAQVTRNKLLSDDFGRLGGFGLKVSRRFLTSRLEESELRVGSQSRS